MPDGFCGDDDMARFYQDRARQIGEFLAVPIEEQIGEGIREAAFRAISKNAFRSTDIVIELSEARSFRSLSGISEGAIEELERLADVLGIKKDSEHTRALLSNSGFAGKDWIRYFGINIRRGHLATRRRVAPRSLKRTDCLEAVWSLRPLGFDLKSKETLLDHCPVCERALGWRKTFGPSFCDICPSARDPFRGGVDLRDFPQPLTEVVDGEAIEFVASLVDPAAPRRGLALHSDLNVCSDGDLFQFIVEIGNRLDGNPAGWGKAIQSHSIERAGRAVLDWPRGFENIVEGGGSDRKFERIHLDPKLPRQLRRLLADRSEQRVRERLTARIRCQSDMSAPRLNPLRNSLAELRVAATSISHVSVREAAVLLLRRSGNARCIADLLGLPIPYLIDFYEAGMLPELLPVLEGVLPPPPIAKGSIVDRLNRLDCSLARQTQNLSIGEMSLASASLDGWQWAMILAAIADERLSAVRRFNSHGLVYQFYCSFENLPVFFVETQLSAVNGVSFTQSEIAMAICKSRSVVRHLLENGLLPQNADLAAIKQFRRQWIFRSEIYALSSISGHMDGRRIRTLLSRSKLTTVSTQTATLWSRAEITGLISEYHRGLDRSANG